MAVNLQPPVSAFPEDSVGINVGINVAFQAQSKQRSLGLRHLFVGLTRFFVAFAKLSVKESYKKIHSYLPKRCFLLLFEVKQNICDIILSV